MTQHRLVADIGGTNVRFALADAGGSLAFVRAFRVEEFSDFAAALAHYLERVIVDADITACAVGAAGPFDRGAIKLTNNDWHVSLPDLEQRLGDVPMALVNDLEAVAAALPHLAATDQRALGPQTTSASGDSAMLALNIGTGFGAASAIRRGGRWWTVPGEAGHMSLTAADDEERAWIATGSSVESALSGPAIARRDARVTSSSGDSDRNRVLGSPVLARIIGRVAGDLALAAGAWSGVFLCGSVATAWAQAGDMTEFRAAFEDKGSMRERMRHVPTSIIVKPDVALYGLAMIEVAHASSRQSGEGCGA